MERLQLDMEARFGNMFYKLKDEQEHALNELANTANQIFQNAEFIKPLEKKLKRYIDQEISLQLNDLGLHTIIRKKIESEIKDNFKSLIDKIFEKVVNGINKKLTYEYNMAKDLSLSLDSQINSLVRKSGLSYETEKVMKLKIMKELNNISYKQEMKMIEG